MQTRLLSWVSNPVVQLTIVLLVAAVLRLSHLWYAETLPMFSEPTVDAAVYHERAIAISSGDWMLGGAPLRMSPGYHYLLGAVYSIFGSGSWPIRIVQMIAGVLTVAFVWDTARRLFGVPWAWLPALAMAAYGPAIFYESARLATTAALGVHALLLWLVVATLQCADRRLISWMVIGVLWGVCCTIRPNALLLGLPIGLAAAGLLTSWRGALGAAALLRVVVMVLAALIAMAPVTLRNSAASGEFVLLTDHGGPNFFIGNGPGANGMWRIPPEVPTKGVRGSFAAFHDVAERELGRELTGGESDRFWYAAGLNALISNPSRSAGLIMTKLRLFWNGYELSSVYHYHFYRLINPVLGMPLVQFLWLAPLAVVGTFLMLGGTPATRFVALFNLTICLGLVLFFVLGRYRLSMMPGALIAATFTLRTIAGAVVDHMRLRTGVYVICVVAAFKLAWPISIDPHFEDEFYKLGVDYHRQERPIEAESAYKKALGFREDHLFARRNLAMLYDATGRSSEALLHWPNVARLARRQGDQALADYAQHQLETGGARR